MAAETIAKALGKARRSGKTWTALCPAHDDHAPSLTLNDGDDGRILAHCKVGCSQDAVIGALKGRNLWPESPAAERRNAPAAPVRAAAPSAADDWCPIIPPPADAPTPDLRGWDHVYAYRDRDGTVLRYVLRRDARGDRRKQVIPLTWGTLNGITGWHKKHATAPRHLCGLDRLDRPAAIIIVEGEKAADAAQRMLPRNPCLTWSAGTNAVGLTDWSPLTGRTAIVWPDADDPGLKAAVEIAAILGGLSCTVKLVDVEGLPQGFDAADLVTDDPQGWLRARLRDAPPLALPAPAPPTHPHPADAPADGQSGATAPPVGGFVMRRNGLFWTDPSQEAPDILLSGPFEVTAEARNTIGSGWSVVLKWKDHDGREHEEAIPRSMLAGDGMDCRKLLADGGLFIASSRKAREKFTDYLNSASVPARATCVDRTGWHGRVYVSIRRSFGDLAGERVLLQATSAAAMPPPRGSLDGWRVEVAAPAVGNSRLAFALSAAFAGPLLFLLSEESGGIHFKGPSSIGKSSALHVAASAWGCQVYNWRSTDNAAESLARGANDALLCLDELGQADGRAADAMAYMLSNDSGKARLNRDTSARPVSTWRLLFLSTGELGLAEKLAEAGRRVRAGQETRLLDITADAGAGMGAFQHLHGSLDGDAFARRLRLACESHRGHAAHTFLEKITAADLDELVAAVRAGRDRWLAAHLPAGADGQVSRAAGRFGLIAAAGELAAAMGVLFWPADEATRAAAACFKAWIGARGGIGAAEITAGLAQVRGFLESHAMSRFQAVWSDCEAEARPVPNRAGFRRKNDYGDWEYFVLPEAFREMCKGLSAKDLAAALVKAGMLCSDTSGKTSKVVKVPGQGNVRVYHFPAAALTDNGDDA